MGRYSDDIESFMSKDDLEGLLRFLKVLNEVDANTKSKLSSLAGRLSKLESDRSIGILSQAEYSKERNQIRYGIIQVSNAIEVRTEKEQLKKERKDKYYRMVKKYGVVFLLTLAGIYFLFKVISYISYVNSVNIPYKYVNKDININSINDIYNDIQQDSSVRLRN